MDYGKDLYELANDVLSLVANGCLRNGMKSPWALDEFTVPFGKSLLLQYYFWHMFPSSSSSLSELALASLENPLSSYSASSAEVWDDEGFYKWMSLLISRI